MLKHLAEQRDHSKEVSQKAFEENCNFRNTVREKLNQKMLANMENRSAQMAALNEKFKEKVRSHCYSIPTRCIFMLNVGEKRGNYHDPFVF